MMLKDRSSRLCASKRNTLWLLAVSFLTTWALSSFVSKRANLQFRMIRANHEEEKGVTFELRLNNLKADADAYASAKASTELAEKDQGMTQALIEKMRRAKFEGHTPTYNFVLVEGYRLGARSFAAVALATLAQHGTRKLQACFWRNLQGAQMEGKIEGFTPGEHHDLMYEILVLHCTFPEGALLPSGGELSVQMDGEVFVVHTEKGGEGRDFDPQPPFKYEVTFCSAPIYGKVQAKYVYEWLEYHKFMGMDYFVIYDAGGVDDALRQVLEPYLSRGVMELVNATENMKYQTWLYSQGLLMHDCMYRLRYSTEWAVFMDFDEYFLPAQRHLKYADVLRPHHGKPYVTVGSLWWSVDQCERLEDSDSLWAVEKMRYHWPHVYCENKKQYPTCELALQHYGYRKVIVNPRLVTSLNIHNTNIPFTGGADLHTGVALNNHYKGLLRADKTTCDSMYFSNETVVWWWRTDEVANMAMHAREAPFVPRAETTLSARLAPPSP